MGKFSEYIDKQTLNEDIDKLSAKDIKRFFELQMRFYHDQTDLSGWDQLKEEIKDELDIKDKNFTKLWITNICELIPDSEFQKLADKLNNLSK
jgi:hypothetical protein